MPFAGYPEKCVAKPHTFVVCDGSHDALQERRKDAVHQGHVLAHKEGAARISPQLLLNRVHGHDECPPVASIVPASNQGFAAARLSGRRGPAQTQPQGA